MSDIQVGDFVRTKKQGIRRIDTIFKNKTVNKYGYEIGSEWDGKLYSIIKTTDITKYSQNLIDLIEVGDYVNGLYVHGICDYGLQVYMFGDAKEILEENEIKSIVTHQQFNSVMYKVKE